MSTAGEGRFAGADGIPDRPRLPVDVNGTASSAAACCCCKPLVRWPGARVCRQAAGLGAWDPSQDSDSEVIVCL